MSYTENEIDYLKRQLENAEHYKMGYNQAKKTLYTEEQVKEAIYLARSMSNRWDMEFEYESDEIIKLLKNK